MHKQPKFLKHYRVKESPPEAKALDVLKRKWFETDLRYLCELQLQSCTLQLPRLTSRLPNV
jgi:hypothetical protein